MDALLKIYRIAAYRIDEAPKKSSVLPAVENILKQKQLKVQNSNHDIWTIKIKESSSI